MNIKNFLEIIKQISLFKDFSSEELIQLFKNKTYRIEEYKKNSIIHLQNEKCSTLDIILKGIVVVQKIDVNGNILTISTFTTGDVIGGNLIFSRNFAYPMTILSKSQCTVLHVDKDLILELCQKNKTFLIKFLESISDKTLILTDKIKSISLKTIRQCIVEFLTYEYYHQKSNVIKLEMTKKELSERIGIQRPSLSRELNKMRQDGLVEYDRNFITIKDINLIKNL